MNTNDKDAWYHCGHCGSLFQSDYGFDEDRKCEVCQRKPGVGLWPAVNPIGPEASAKVAGFHKMGDRVKKLARTPTTKKRRLRATIWVTLIWMLVLLGAIGLRYYLESAPSKPLNLEVSDLDRSLSSSDRLKILDQVLPACDRAIRGFLSATTFEDRSKFVGRSVELKAAMEADAQYHSFPQIDGKTLQRTGQEWIRLGTEWMVLTHWKDTSGQNEFDAVFRKESDGWKLDWPHFSRYSETSWRLFLAGEGKLDQAEFRLLARQHQEGKTPGLSDQRMMIVLAATEWGNPKQVVSESPTISIDLMSREGELLKAAFELREKNLAVGEGELAPLDPEGFVRVRVLVTRDELGGQFRLILNELKAGHWMDSDLSGF